MRHTTWKICERNSALHAPSKQSGFTLIEIIIALFILAMITAMLTTYFEPWAEYKARIDTQNKLAILQEALTDAYRDNAYAIENNPGQVITLPNGNITPTNVATNTTFAGLMNYASASPATMARDGYGKALTVFVSDMLSKNIGGTTLDYHVIAIVSSGEESGPVKSTFNASTGALTLAPAETAVLINGYDIQYGLYKTTLDRLDNLSQLYQTYFLSRYMNDPGRSYGVDYFACGDVGGGCGTQAQWDSTGSIQNSQGQPATAAQVNLQSTLGLSNDDVTDAWGNPIYVDNDSSATRNPYNANTSMTTPPFTASIYANLPGGQKLSVTAQGTYQ